MTHRRRSIRLKDYDYAQNGAYFVTLCAHERRHLFGEVVNGDVALNEWGRIVQSCWDEIPAHYPMVELDAFVVMPNHVHGVIVIANDDVRAHRGDGDVGAQHGHDVRARRGDDDVRAHRSDDDVRAQYIAPQHTPQPAPKRGVTPNNVTPNSLGSIVRTFKAAASRRINRLPNPPDHPIWQRNYHEHIIRHTKSLDQIRAYVAGNPAKWAEDSLFAT